MAKILKQQQNLCSLFAMASIFSPNITLPELQVIIKGYGINVKTGITLVQENMILSHFTDGTLQLVPWFLDTYDKISLTKFEMILSIPDTQEDGNGSSDLFLAVALHVKSELLKNLFHRIWIIKKFGDPLIVIDTNYDETKILDTVDFLNKYSVHGIFGVHYVARKKEIMLKKNDFEYLF